MSAGDMKRRSWRVKRLRLRLLGLSLTTPLGYVNARTREDAMARARAKWPDERVVVEVNTDG